MFRIRIRMDPHWLFSCIRIRIGNADPDQGAKKIDQNLKKSNFQPFKMAFIPTLRRYVLWQSNPTFCEGKVIPGTGSDLHCFGSLDPDLDPHGGKKLDLNPHWNQCGSETLSVYVLYLLREERGHPSRWKKGWPNFLSTRPLPREERTQHGKIGLA